MRQVIYKNAIQYLKGQKNVYNNCINSKFIGNQCLKLNFRKVNYFSCRPEGQETPTRMLSCKMCEIFKNIYSEEHLWTTGFAPSSIANVENRHPEAVVRRCSVKKVFLKNLKNSQENFIARASFLMKLQATTSGFLTL